MLMNFREARTKSKCFCETQEPLSGFIAISINGGTQPRWSPDGEELFFVAPDLKMMSAGIKTTGSTIEVAPPVA